MSIQSIIDKASSITISRRKVAGQTVSRSGQVKISSIASNVPWVFEVTYPDNTQYSTNRSLFEEIDRLDRVFTETIDIGSTNTNLSYITAYQGDFTSGQIAQVTIDSGSALNVVANMSAVTGESSSDYVFKKGDLFKLSGAYKYPYTVTADVTRGVGTTVNVPINRPFIDQAGYTEAGAGIVVGSDVTWQVVMSKKPSYTIVPYDRAVFDGSFELVEVIED
jgi:hypothetical protein